MPNNSDQLTVLDTVDQDVLISYAAFLAGRGPVYDIMKAIRDLEPAERLMVEQLWHRTYKSDGTPDKRRAENRTAAEPADDNEPPFDPPYSSVGDKGVTQ